MVIGLSELDDAGVIRAPSGDLLVQTVDFFTPIVDDPELFGAAAAANALSDIYAMGGTPLSALTVACFPDDKLPMAVLRTILQGARAKLAEAGCALLGGHTVRDREVKFGFAITGTVTPERLMTQSSARPGDLLVLTKAIGTGVLATAMKRGVLTNAGETALAKSLSRLNAAAANAAAECNVKCATDVTGFGLIGHCYELACQSGVGLRLFARAVPLLPTAYELAGDRSNLAGGLHRNRLFVEANLRIHFDDPPRHDLMFDPQTSGGLLLAVSAERCDELCNRLLADGDVAAVIGEFTADFSGIELLDR